MKINNTHESKDWSVKINNTHESKIILPNSNNFNSIVLTEDTGQFRFFHSVCFPHLNGSVGLFLFCHGDYGYRYQPIIYDTPECGYSEGSDGLVQLYREFRRDRQTKIGEYVDTRIKGTFTRNTIRVLRKYHYMVVNLSVFRHIHFQIRLVVTFILDCVSSLSLF